MRICNAVISVVVTIVLLFYLTGVEVSRLKAAPFRHTPTKGERLPITLAMVDYKSPLSLNNTLHSYRKNGLFDLVNESLMYLQEIQTYNRASLSMLGDYPFRLVLSSLNNTYVHGAMLELIKASSQPYVLFLEKDFELVEQRTMASYRLTQAMELLDSGNVAVVRLKNRLRPGVPEFGRMLYKDREIDVFNGSSFTQDMACQVLYWLGDEQFEALLDEVQPQYFFPSISIRKCSGDHWCFPTQWCHWTNQAVMFRRDWFVATMLSFLTELTPRGDNEYQRHHALEVACRYGYHGCRWRMFYTKQVAVSPGLFRHRDLEKYPYNTTFEDARVN